jgi:hypothetical protein
MRTYGLDTNTGKWTLLTTLAFTGASNPVTTEIDSTYGVTSRNTSTLYNSLVTFPSGSELVTSGDILLNDQITDLNGNVLFNRWQDITTGVVLPEPPLITNVAIQQSGFANFFADYGLSVGEVVVVDVSYIWLATLAQTLRLNTNESPFYANYGIPAQQSVQTQIAPTIAITNTQQQFSPYFKSLSIFKQPNTVNPIYNIRAVFLDGTIIQSVVAT